MNHAVIPPRLGHEPSLALLVPRGSSPSHIRVSPPYSDLKVYSHVHSSLHITSRLPSVYLYNPVPSCGTDSRFHGASKVSLAGDNRTDIGARSPLGT